MSSEVPDLRATLLVFGNSVDPDQRACKGAIDQVYTVSNISIKIVIVLTNIYEMQ